jgi:hypothetical protein
MKRGNMQGAVSIWASLSPGFTVVQLLEDWDPGEP